jgi:diguanylate cyclase (GGDEF)-like protein
MYLSDGEGSLQIEESSGCDAHPGDLIEVVGFPAAVHGRPGLQDSICRRVGRGSVSRVIPVTAEQVLPDFSYSADNGWVSPGIAYDMKMITTEGLLMESFPGPEGETWSLEASGRNFIAKLPAAGRKLIRVGSRVRLTGLCVLTYDRYRRVQFFRILAPDWGDISLVARPSWWNLRLALWSVGSSTLVCLFALAWVYLLRTQVRLQTGELKRANSSLRRLSNLDALTGVANRRYFEETLEAEIMRARRSDVHVSLLMVDVDYFKGINDSFGHLKGDECLIKIARTLETAPRRSTDFVARFGGEEFTVILPSDEKGAQAAAESTRRRVADLAVPNPGSPFMVMTVSIGVSTLKPGSNASATDLISAADRGLYEAKRMGRNRVGPVCEPVAGRDRDSVAVKMGEYRG